MAGGSSFLAGVTLLGTPSPTKNPVKAFELFLCLCHASFIPNRIKLSGTEISFRRCSWVRRLWESTAY
jgi:hypothetical protein